MYEEALKKIGYKTVHPFTFSYEKSRFKNAITGGNDVIISGTGYTGEKGVEIICSSDEAVEIWRNLNEVLKPINGKTCGLGCRDTLRMEKGMLLSGVDFNNDKTPYECSISFILIFFINEFICLPYAFLFIETSMMFIPFTLLSPVSEEIIMSPAHVPIMGKPSFAFSFITSYRPYSRISLYMVVLSPPGMVDFHGWEMPIEYSKIIDEHVAVRNAYGRQINSFIKNISIKDIGDFPAVFIRAPIIESPGTTEVLGYDDGKPVIIRKGNVLGMTFHPELTGKTNIHEYFMNMIEGEGYTSTGNFPR